MPSPIPDPASLPDPAADADRAPVLELDGLAVGYDGYRVCGAINARLGAGDCLALVGANGTGMTTVLHTIAGLLPTIDGTASLLGGPIDERRAAFRRRVATVFDHDAYFPDLTVAEHLILVASAHGDPGPRDRTDAELHCFGITESADALPYQLSSGQRRRMLLAAAFVRPSDVLLLDEPEQRLDPSMRAVVRQRLAAASAAGTTIVYATHDAEFVTQCASRALLLSERVREIDPQTAAQALGSL